MEAVQAVTLGIACIGCGLGILNTWKTFDKERTRLIVLPRSAFPTGVFEAAHPNVDFCIEVVNRSAFPVIVAEVGFFFSGSTARAAVLWPLTMDGKGGFPRKLEAREAASFFMEKPAPHGGRSISYCYARTADDRTFRSAIPA